MFGLVLQHLAPRDLAALRQTSRAALAAVRAHCTSAEWEWGSGGCVPGRLGDLARFPALRAVNIKDDCRALAEGSTDAVAALQAVGSGRLQELRVRAEDVCVDCGMPIHDDDEFSKPPDFAGFFVALLRSRTLALRRAEFRWTNLEPLWARMLEGAALHAPQVLRLELCGLTPRVGTALAHAASGMPALRTTLLLSDNHQFCNAGAVALAAAGTALSALRSLDVSCTGLSGSSGVIAIANAWHRQLVRLNLGTNRAPNPHSHAAPAAVAELARVDWLAMRFLKIPECHLQDVFARLMQADMRALQVFDCAANELHSLSLEALAGALEAGRLPELGELYLNGAWFSDAQGAQALARAATCLCALRVLDFTGCYANSAVFHALVGSTLPALRTLLLSGWGFEARGLQTIAGAPWAARLETLVVTSCSILYGAMLDALPLFPRMNALAADDVFGCSVWSSPSGWVYDRGLKLFMGEATQEEVNSSSMMNEHLTYGAFRRLAVGGPA